MKKLLIVITGLFFVNYSFAQWVSPGNGQTYTLESLCTAAPSAVQASTLGHYVISQNLTLSANDMLTLESSAMSVVVNNGVTLTIIGCLQTETRNQPLVFHGDSTQNNYFELRFEESSLSSLLNVHFRYCQGIKLINSGIVIDSCEFDHFSNHVIGYINCHPVIRNCYFHDNQACAIQSAVNADGCPRILNNVFYNNVLANTNNPQINIGPGTTDTIFIIGNRIEGVASTMSGGIGISNLSNPGVTHVLLKDNVITNNRYGYTQNGYRISAEIYDNQFIDNDLEVTPNNGGSGISIYGYDTTCAAKLRRNLITGNLWGVTAIYYHHLDMGTAEDPGYNVLYNNGNGGVDYELYNNANSDMNAIGNYWGYSTADSVENVIFHKPDNDSYGLVTYIPFCVSNPESTQNNLLTKINLFPNPVSQGFFTLENPTEKNLNWKIFTSTGQCIMFGEAQPGTNRIATKGLKSGTYLVYIQKDNTFITRKLIVR